MQPLDFSRLDEIVAGVRSSTKDSPVQDKPEEGHDDPEKDADGSAMWASLKRKQQVYDEMLYSYKRVQENERTGAQLKSELLHEMEAGKPLPDLLLKACEAIAVMTGDEGFLSMAEDNLMSIYSYGLSDPAVLERELTDVRNRKASLKASLNNSDLSADCRDRINAAIAAHDRREAKILDEIADH